MSKAYERNNKYGATKQSPRQGSALDIVQNKSNGGRSPSPNAVSTRTNKDLVDEIGLGVAQPSKQTIKKEKPETDVTFSGDEGEDHKLLNQTDAQIANQQGIQFEEEELVDVADPLNFDREVQSHIRVPAAKGIPDGVDKIGAFNEYDDQHTHQTSWEDFEKPKGMGKGREEEKETATEIERNRRIYKHFHKNQIESELQDILGELMNQGTTSLDVIRNNAATFGNVLGAEYIFWDRGNKANVVDDEDFFYDRKQMNLQELTFKDIEKTPLGKLIKSQCGRLEQKVKGF